MKSYSPETIRREVRQKEEEILTEKERVVDIKPEEEKFELPLVVAPGWGNLIEPVIENSFQVMADEGRRVLSLDFPRRMKIEGDKDQPVEHIQKAMALLELLEKKEIEKAEGAGHSEGGLVLAIAAMLAPEKFDNLVFVSPAGMIGKDSLLGLAHRFVITEGKKSKIPLPPVELAKGFLKYILANPLMALREPMSTAQSDLYEAFKDLKEKGLGISVICANNDDVFLMDEVQEEYRNRKQKRDFAKPEDLFDGFYSVKGSHSEFLGHGEEVEKHLFPKAVHGALVDLEKKRARQAKK